MDGMLFCRPKSWIPTAIFVVGLAAVTSGCQTAQPVSVRRLINHQAMIDFSGLRSVEHFDSVKAQGAPPRSWKQLAAKRGPMYTDMQWKSPSGTVAVGVAYVRMPLPFSARGLLWFAKGHYAKESEGGRVIDEWVDHLGRSWFEAENRKYHVRGYIVTQGRQAWIVYSGYKMQVPADMSEMTLGARALETMVPAPRNRVVATAEAD